MDKFDLKHFNIEPIDTTCRLYIMAELGVKVDDEDKEANQILLNHKQFSTNIHCTAMCLYTALIMSKLLADHVTGNAPTADIATITHFEHEGDKTAAKICMRAYKNNSTLSDEQLDAALHNEVVRNIRNCFAHGSVKIAYNNRNPKNALFVLEPNKSIITTPHRLIIPFADLWAFIDRNYVFTESVK